MKNSMPFMLAALCLAPAHGAPVPPHLTGSWGTAQSLFAGTTEQAELHLDTDGLGIFAASSKPAMPIDDKTNARGPRVVLGFPVEATVEGGGLSLKPLMFLLMPPRKENPKEAQQRIVCHFEKVGPVLQCAGPDGKTVNLKFLSETIPAEAARTLAEVRLRLSAKPE